MKHPAIIPFLLLTLVAIGCESGVYYDKQVAVDQHGWLPSDEAVFEVNVTDTTQIFNFLLEVRNNIDYPYANTFFFIHTLFPDGSIAYDTLEFPLADPSGRWLGRRTGRYIDTRYYFRRNARFPQEGTYQFAISNGMRDSAITGLHDVGLRIEYSTKK